MYVFKDKNGVVKTWKRTKTFRKTRMIWRKKSTGRKICSLALEHREVREQITHDQWEN